MTARITLPAIDPATTHLVSFDPATTDQPARNRAARRARGKGANPAPAGGAPAAAHGTVSTKPVHHRTDYAARRSG